MIIKRFFDIIAAFIGLIVLMPLLIVIGCLIKIKMPIGPIFFKQKRIGKNAKLFTMYKFRTMTNTHKGSSISVAGEDRITSLGRILRKYKIDELPELWNVLIGDMSLVGPRPDVPGYADKLVGKSAFILKLRPGITGPASLKYRNEEELLSYVDNPQEYNDQLIYPDKVKINLKYYSEWSFWLDLRIIYCTIFNKELKDFY